MHPLSIFPSLLSFGLIAPLLLRLIVSIFIAWLGWERYKKEFRWLSIVHAIIGVLLFMGLYTQVSAILGIILISSDYFIDKGNQTFSKEKKWLFVIVKVILLSLLVTGPGFLAFDLPL